MSRRRRVFALAAGALLVGCAEAPDATPAPMPYAEPVTVALADADRRVSDLARVDIGDAVAAPSVTTRPPGRALLVATVIPFGPESGTSPMEVGEPVVLAADGGWRRVLPEEYEAGDDWGVETPAALSDDGRVLAVLEEGTDRVIVVDLADGGWSDVRLPTRDAVAFEVDRRGTTLTFADRETGLDRGWRRIDFATGTVAPVDPPWEVRASAYDAEGASTGLRVGNSRLAGTPREMEWLGPVGGDSERVVAADGFTGRIYVWRPTTASLELVGRVRGGAVSLGVAAEVLRAVD